MWNDEDSLMWFWLNLITTACMIILAIEQFTVLIASPFGVVGYVIVGWVILRMLEYISVGDGDECINEVAYGMSAVFGLLIQTILVSVLSWNQWLLTGGLIWLYAPVLPITYWLSQITYRIAKTYRCEPKE